MNYTIGYCFSCGVEIRAESLRPNEEFCSYACYQSRLLSLGDAIEAIFSAMREFDAKYLEKPTFVYLGRNVMRALLIEIRESAYFSLGADHVCGDGVTFWDMSVRHYRGIGVDVVRVTTQEVAQSRPWVRCLIQEEEVQT